MPSFAPTATKWLPEAVAKVTDRCFEATGNTCFICDFSPPRSGDPSAVQQAEIDADFISVAYNPGRAVRTNSVMLAAGIGQRTGKDVVFTLATRDMNKLAAQSLLLGAQLMGLENVVVVQGDPFTKRDLETVSPVDDYVPTGLIAAITQMNQGLDFRGSELRAATDFCIGGTVDLSRGVESEAALAARKVRGGAQFLMTQPIFSAEEAARYHDAYANQPGGTPPVSVFFGLQILEQDEVVFSSVPESVRSELEAGRSGIDIALQLYHQFQTAAIHNIYLVPPIRRGGTRNYAAARDFLEAVN